MKKEDYTLNMFLATLHYIQPEENHIAPRLTKTHNEHLLNQAPAFFSSCLMSGIGITEHFIFLLLL